MRPLSSNLPVRPTTAFSLSRASVTAGSSRFTAPALIFAFSASGRASASTLSPTASAVFGLTLSIALCSCKASPKKASEPKVSKRKICLPSSIRRRAVALMWRSFWDSPRSRSSFPDSSSARPNPTNIARAMAGTPMKDAVVANLMRAVAPLFALRVREVGDEIGTLLRVRHTGIGHGRARHGADRIGEEALQVLLGPGELRALHRRGILEPGHAARPPADQAAVTRPDAVVGERMAGSTAWIDGLARLGVARSERCDEQRA